MSKRLFPYRKISPSWLKDTFRSLPKFFLVGITGPFSFILQDLKNIKYKITIGNQLKCSCSVKLNDHCVHTLFILSDVFYLQQNDPIVWQTSYLNQELRYMLANRRIKLNKITQFLKYVKPGYLKINKVILQESDEQDEQDNLCAICQQQMIKSDMITSCTKMCKNSFHLQCFKQWGQFQLTSGKKITCPLCRDQKDQQFLMQLRIQQSEHKQQQLNKKIGITYNYYCDGCHLRQIEQNKDVYKCLVCQDVILCQSCFLSGRHLRHSFIVKKGGSRKWTYTQDRKNKKKFDQQQNLVRIKICEPKFYNFLASSLPCYFNKNTRQNILQCKKMEIKIQDLECIMCQDKQRAFLRRLYCGHFIHHKCLKRRIQKSKLFCKLDGQKFLRGYDNLIQNQKLNKIIQKGPEIVKQQLKEELEEQLNDYAQDKKQLKREKSQQYDKSRSPSKGKVRKLSNSCKKNSELFMEKSFNPE